MATPTFVNGQAAAASGGATTIAIPAMNVSSGNTIAVVAGHYTPAYPGQAIQGIADTAGNSYSMIAAGGGDANHRQEIWIAYNATANASNVITVTYHTFNVSYRAAAAVQYSGLPSGKFIAASTASLTSTGTTHATGTISTGVSDAFLIGSWTVWDTNRTVSGSGGTTIRAQDTASANIVMGDRAVTPAGSYSTQITSSASTSFPTLAVAFDTTDAGATGQPTTLRHWGVPGMKRF